MTANSNNYLAYEFDANGPTGLVKTSLASSLNTTAVAHYGAALALSPDGTKIASVISSGSTTAANNVVRQFYFNAQGGELIETGRSFGRHAVHRHVRLRRGLFPGGRLFVRQRAGRHGQTFPL